jgi:hypothetical protein
VEYLIPFLEGLKWGTGIFLNHHSLHHSLSRPFFQECQYGVIRLAESTECQVQIEQGLSGISSGGSNVSGTA